MPGLCGLSNHSFDRKLGRDEPGFRAMRVSLDPVPKIRPEVERNSRVSATGQLWWRTKGFSMLQCD
jgi:hypothetical protein